MTAVGEKLMTEETCLKLRSDLRPLQNVDRVNKERNEVLASPKFPTKVRQWSTDSGYIEWSNSLKLSRSKNLVEAVSHCKEPLCTVSFRIP